MATGVRITSQSAGITPTSYASTFTASDLTGDNLIIAHNLNDNNPVVQVQDNAKNIIQPDLVTFDDANQITINLESYATIEGTWRVKVIA